ncbi:MAG: DeoR/GlpR family DNA-binding transcription regulator [Desulfitobacteriaceae bacterium]
MLAEDRRKKIIGLLDESGSVRVAQLSNLFKVTEETIRRDLEQLEKDGYLSRTHGGAIKNSLDQQETAFSIRNMRNPEEKKLIGNKAVEFISPGEVIALDASTTALQVAQFLKECGKKDIVVITHALKVVMTLADSPNITVISTGGVLQQRTMSFVGPIAENALTNYNIKKAFVSCKGLTVEEGITESTDVQATMKGEFIKAAKEIFLLVDHDKFGQAALATVAPVTVAHKLLTDKGTPQREVEAYRALGLEVIIAG